MNGIAIIQKISVTWTKKFRAGVGAVKRNSIPDVMSLPDSIHVQNENLLLHNVSYSHQDRFEKPNETVELMRLRSRLRLGCVVCEVKDDFLAIQYQYDSGIVGAPYRSDHPREFMLKSGEWGQISYNGRLTEEGAWYYRKVSFNVGLFMRIEGNSFLNSMPKKVITDIKNLR